jgi:cytoplasmic iron level regulating protein YaaA (DUF328/UPF0246 family)
MLALISPAKKLDFAPLPTPLPATSPQFPDDARELVETARALSRGGLQRLMKLSDSLTELNYTRFKDFDLSDTTENRKQAALAFAGDTYAGLEASSLNDADLHYGQAHLRILSGLYGLLRPLDLIQPYRLEMGRRLGNHRGGDLYDYWGDKIRQAVDDTVRDHDSPTVINLASNEYFKVVRAKELKARVVTPIFKEEKQGVSKVIGLFAKRARGAMARYIIKNRIETPDALKSFAEDGYIFQEAQSSADEWVFIRKQ